MISLIRISDIAIRYIGIKVNSACHIIAQPVSASCTWHCFFALQNGMFAIIITAPQNENGQMEEDNYSRFDAPVDSMSEISHKKVDKSASPIWMTWSAVWKWSGLRWIKQAIIVAAIHHRSCRLSANVKADAGHFKQFFYSCRNLWMAVFTIHRSPHSLYGSGDEGSWRPNWYLTATKIWVPRRSIGGGVTSGQYGYVCVPWNYQVVGRSHTWYYPDYTPSPAFFPCQNEWNGLF